MGGVTRKDVALRAGVSETVVSYVLNRNRYVDADKRRRVLSAVKELGYVPSPLARALKGKGSGRILLVTDHLESDHFVSLVSEMEKRASQEGLSVSLCRWHPGQAFLQNILQSGYDGVLVGSTTMDDASIQNLIDSGMAVVVLEIKERAGLSGRYGIINSGLHQGALDAMDALRKRGRKKIVYVSSLGALEPEDFRYRAYVEKVDSPRLVCGAMDDRELGQKVKNLWEENPFDGLFCRTDYVACAAMHALLSLGVRIPDQVSICGFDDAWCGRCMFPTLTTVHIRRDLMAQNAMELFSLLARKEEGAIKPIRIELQTQFVTRESL